MKYEIPDEDLSMLDGKCSEATQSIVNEAKARLALKAAFSKLTEKQIEFIHEVKSTALKEKRLVYMLAYSHWCPVCQKSGGYAKYPRNGRHHRKGDSNYDKPLNFSGRDFTSPFVRMRDRFSLGACDECVNAVMPALKTILSDVEAELPSIFEPKRKLKRWDEMVCTCGWTGPECEMIKLRTIFNDGWYYGKCPSCKAENGLMTRNIKTTGKHILLEVRND